MQIHTQTRSTILPEEKWHTASYGLLQEQLKNPDLKKEWDDIQPEMDVIRAMIDARIEQNLTQKELASGLGMQLKIEFVPMQVSRK